MASYTHTPVSEPAGQRSLTRPPQGSQSVHLDALRGCAAFFVLLTHWRAALFLNYEDIPHKPLLNAIYLLTGLGHQWVIVFFVMSGYLVGGSVLRQVAAGRWSWRGYLLTRLTRLYMVLIPALLLGGAADWIGMNLPWGAAFYNGHTGMGSQHYDIHTTLNLFTLARNLIFLQTISFHGIPVPTFGTNEPLWSLCNEFFYYIAFPLLVLGLLRRQLWFTRAMCAAGLIGLGWFVGPKIALLGIPWLMGAMLAYRPSPYTLTGWNRGLALGAASAICAGAMVYSRIHEGVGSEILLGVFVTFLIWTILNVTTQSLPEWYVHVAQRSAHSSYTLYLVHVPALILIKALFRLPQSYPAGTAIWISFAVLAGIILYAQLVYELFERRTAEVRDWFKRLLDGGYRKSASGPEVI
jgi:peptidoglycan/LPS O-acetylase OafA/YrhL